MNTINNVSNFSMMGNINNRQRPDPQQMANDIFTRLDTDNRGYIEQSDLTEALSKLDSTGNNNADISTEEMFAKMDGDGDGKVTQQEMAATFEQIASELDGPFPRRRLQEQMPPPPPPEGEAPADEGFTLEQLTEMSSQSASMDDPNNELFAKLAENFDAADADGNGKISREEAMDFMQQEDSEAQTGQTSVSEVDRQFMSKMAELFKSYQSFEEDVNQVSLTV